MSTITRLVAILAVGALFVASVGDVRAVVWTGNAGPANEIDGVSWWDWHNDANWGPGGEPGASDEAYVGSAADGQWIRITQELATARAYFRQDAEITVDLGADWQLGNYLVIGRDTAGITFNHQEGIELDVAAILEVGGRPSGKSVYNMDGGAIDVGTEFRLGHSGGTGTFNMEDGTVDIGGRFHVGYDNGTGTFKMEDGTVNAGQDLFVGTSGGIGTFTMERGSLTVVGRIIAGYADGTSIVNMYDGTMDVDGEIYVGRTGATGTFNMHGGELNARDDISVGRYGGSGTFNMHGGTLDAKNGLLAVGHDSGSSGTFVQHGGTVRGVDRWEIGRGGGYGEYTIKGGELDVGEGMYALLGRGTPALFVKYGAAQVNFDVSDRWRIGWNSSGGEATFRAVLDRTGFTPIIAGNVGLAEDGASAHLEVALDGGVMLSGKSTFELISIGDAITHGAGAWTSTPDHLWHVTTDNNGVSIALDTAYRRGTLDASDVGDSVSMGEGERVHGFIEMGNPESLDMIELLLDFGWDGAGSEEDTWSLFTGELGEAGYTILDVTDNHMTPWLSLAMDMDGISTEYFVWDLSNYVGGAQLELQSVTVVPEPSALVLLGIAGLLLPLRRRRA